VRFSWSPEAQQAFERLKRTLAETVTLAYPQPDQTFILNTDASDVAVGAILSTMVDGVQRPIAFFFRVMNAAQRNYCTTRRELLAVIAGLQHFRHYLVGATVILRTYHYSLTWLLTFKRPEGILARWIETFDYTVEHRPGRLYSNVDGLSRPFCKQCYDRPTHIPRVDEMERADAAVGPWSVNLLEIAPEMTDDDVARLQDEDEVLGPVKSMLSHGGSQTLVNAVHHHPPKPSSSDGMAMPSSWWCHTVFAPPAVHSYTRWAPRSPLGLTKNVGATTSPLLLAWHAKGHRCLVQTM